MIHFDRQKVQSNVQLARQIIIGIVICSVVAVFFTSQWFVNPALQHRQTDWTAMLVNSLLSAYAWGILTFGIVALLSRVQWHRRQWLRTSIIYLIAGVVFSLMHQLFVLTARWLIEIWSGRSVALGDILAAHIPGSLHSDLVVFTIIVSVCLAIRYRSELHEREIRSTRLEAELVQAKLSLLRSQLQPHFLFNTLNAISALIHEDPDAAESMVIRLSDLLRTTLANIDQQKVRLSAELELSRTYLAIEQIRFGDRMIVDEQIDPDTLDAAVPAMILQPLAENAVLHGVAATSSECQVSISASRSDGQLSLTIHDSGPGNRNGQDVFRTGVGIANTMKRLQHHFGDRFEFHAGSPPAGGFTASIRIPFSTDCGQHYDQDQAR